MIKKAIVAICILAASISISEAKGRHHYHHVRTHHIEYSNVAAIGGRPSGCPHAFCGCEASRYIFGKIIPELNLASNWARKFPHTSPAAGMVAVRNHHVFVLLSHVGGNIWNVHDGNSGHHQTHEHDRNIAGYTIVNPHGSRYASL